jgi:hypothetical protein
MKPSFGARGSYYDFLPTPVQDESCTPALGHETVGNLEKPRTSTGSVRTALTKSTGSVRPELVEG